MEYHAYLLLKLPTKYSPLLAPLSAWWWHAERPGARAVVLHFRIF
eukprot:SAG11_NODE_17945_length_504_cov_2.274074_2_plen_44_part_01